MYLSITHTLTVDVPFGISRSGGCMVGDFEAVIR